jgi:hypothetical protein
LLRYGPALQLRHLTVEEVEEIPLEEWRAVLRAMDAVATLWRQRAAALRAARQ